MNKEFGGTGNIDNQDFDFGEQGIRPCYFSGEREQVLTGRASLLFPYISS